MNDKRLIFVGIHADLLICVFLGLITLAVYWKVNYYEFINFDDDGYVTENSHVKGGLTLKNIIWAFSFSEKKGMYWQPLAWLSHMLDCHLYGLNPGKHHLTNLIIHIGNSILLFVVFRRMTRSRWKSAFCAALFALHPINVDSVAWVAERKNLLSTFFWMLTLLSYAYFCEKPGLFRYFVTFLFFAIGLLAKPMLVTLPFVLLLLDYWPLKRFRHPISFHKNIRGCITPKSSGDPDQVLLSCKNSFSEACTIRSVLYLVMEKIPFLIASAISVYLSTSSVRSVGNVISLDQTPMTIRVSNALVSYVSYLEKMLWPHNLAVFYPFPNFIPLWKVACSALFLIVASGLVVLVAKRRPYFAVGWFWFLGTLVPVTGLAQTGLWPAFADRWAYVPFIGLFIMLTWGASELAELLRLKKAVFAISAITVLSFLAVTSTLQLRYWKDGATLFEHTLAVTDNNAVAHNNYGNAILVKGKTEEAIKHFLESLLIEPNMNMNAHINLGNIFAKQDKIAEAYQHYSEALKFCPASAKLHIDLSYILAKQGRLDEAKIHLIEALKFNPTSVAAQTMLGNILCEQGCDKEAINCFNEAIKSDTQNELPYKYLGDILQRQGKFEEAIVNYTKAIDLKPDFKEAQIGLGNAHFVMGNLLIGKGEISEAVVHFQKALRANANFAEAHTNLGYALLAQGKGDKAVKHCLEAIKLDPEKSTNAYYNLACIYARKNNVDEAEKWLKKAVDKGFNDWKTLKTDKDLDNIKNSSYYNELTDK